MPMRLAATCLVLAVLAALPARASICMQIAQEQGARLIPASLRLGEHEVSIRFIGHASFRIETPGGIAAVTDYAGWHGGGRAPDVATMNKAHSTHWTANPDPAIAHVLPGWNPEGGPADHYVEVGDMLVRNVPTDIRSWSGAVEPFGNSIFIFEAQGLCIGHLGHLHHKPTDAHYGLIGRLDVVMAPVDGGYTMNIPAMIEVLKRFRARVVLPMHWFGERNLDDFLAGMASEFDIRENGSDSIVLSRDALPSRPTVVVLR
ncbi:MAG: MBL fold metallo-hydrolase [Rubrimonas sp.]|uniref:MBL fold metallo-hydrolase n=1 Tax=Rubrimonas sp. TaxID=2036015 RepID=UPI003DCBD121